MIITGYPGIGKTTLASTTDKVIDLESASFWKVENGQRTRHNDWHVYYCQVAEHLSAQGYYVFVSFHQQVRDWLAANTNEKFCAVYPSLDLKDEWLQRLNYRYQMSGSDKDLRALEHVANTYNRDVKQFYADTQKGYYTNVAVIDDINYDLGFLISNL